MKKISIIILLFVALSCSNVNNDIQPNPKKIFRSNNDYPYHWDRGAQECIPPSQNCMETIVITPQKVNPYRNFLNSVEDGPISIANYFTNGDWHDLFPNIDTDDLMNLRSGNYNIIAVDDGNIIYYLAGQTGTLSTTNEDFVLSVDISLL